MGQWVNGSMGEYLVREGKVTEEQLAEAMQSQANSGRQLGEVLVELGYCSEDDILLALAHQLEMPVVNLREVKVEPDAISLVPAEVAYRHQVLPLHRRDDTLHLAIADPFNVEAEDTIRFITGLEVKLVLAKSSEIRAAIEQHYMRKVMQESATEEIEVLQEAEEEIGDLTRLAREALVIKLVNMLLRNAVRERASDIHIEPFENGLRVRFRIDGVLHEVPAPARRLHPAIVSRIKIMANLDITERRKPQDGRIKIRVLGREIDVRVSVIPTVFGESVVLRILDRSALTFGLEELGMLQEDLEKFAQLINIPYGIVLATGPTGSGKTTTLYAAMRRIYSVERKFITIEDPVEYQLEGVNQIQIHPQVGLTFATGLRSILRHDPDVIMVGEIRDAETAEIAIHSALTGHLVFSTLHTNDASGAITRLLEMGIEPFLVASTLGGVLAQRLVRKICPQCKHAYEASPAESLRVKESKSLRVKESIESMESRVHDYQTLDSKDSRLVLWRGTGCDNCRGTGYFGRTGIFELLVVDDAICELILKKASSGEIKEVACQRGMKTLRQDGWKKVLLGITTVDEVERVTQQDEELEVAL